MPRYPIPSHSFIKYGLCRPCVKASRTRLWVGSEKGLVWFLFKEARNRLGKLAGIQMPRTDFLVAPSRDGSSQCHGSGSMSWVSLVEKAV